MIGVQYCISKILLYYLYRQVVKNSKINHVQFIMDNREVFCFRPQLSCWKHLPLTISGIIHYGESLRPSCIPFSVVWKKVCHSMKELLCKMLNNKAQQLVLILFSKMFVLIKMLVGVFHTKSYWVNVNEGWLLIFDWVYSMKIFWENVCNNNCCNWCWYREPAVSLRYCHLVYPPLSWTQVRACRCPRPPVVVWTAPAHSLRHHQETLHPSLPYKCEWVSSNAGWASNLTLAQSSLFTFFSWNT